MRRTLPLEGIRFCDFTWVGAGSFATKVFADYGAEVIKIETATRPDVLRGMPPFKDRQPGPNRSGYFSNRNTSKKSVTINLSKPEGVALVKRLIAVSDIVSNNFTPGTMEKWGIGYEGCRHIKPDIIYLSMPMHGSSGPHSRYLGYGAVMGALTGFMGQSSFPGGKPQGSGTNYPDHCPNPYHAAVAVMAALLHRRRTGQGQWVELSQVESTVCVLGPLVLAAANGQAVPPLGNDSLETAPHGVYPCAGEDRWVAIACRDEAEWQAFCRICPGVGSDSRFHTLAGRMQHREALNAAIGRWTCEHDPYDVMHRLQAVGIPAGAVQDARDVLENDPQLAHRGHWVRLVHQEMGETVYDAPPARLSKTPGVLRSPAPLLGAHTREVLSGLLGLADGEIDRLTEQGVLT